MNTFEHDYINLVSDVMANGIYRSSRVGETVSVFGAMLRISDMRRGLFPIVTTRQMFPRPVMGELYCFLKGATRLQDFVDAGCNYWTENARAWNRNAGLIDSQMDLGQIYGAQWRGWQFGAVDQIEELIRGIRNDPTSRRHIVSCWNPAELTEMCLPPCHILFQCYVGGDHLSMIVYMRSVDLCLGLPSDIVLYAALLRLLCNELNYMPGDLVFMLADAHVYANHKSLAHLQIRREIHPLPHYSLNSNLKTFVPDDLVLKDYQYNTSIRYALNI